MQLMLLVLLRGFFFLSLTRLQKLQKERVKWQQNPWLYLNSTTNYVTTPTIFTNLQALEMPLLSLPSIPSQGLRADSTWLGWGGCGGLGLAFLLHHYYDEKKKKKKFMSDVRGVQMDTDRIHNLHI
jgi:hypothetical protein